MTRRIRAAGGALLLALALVVVACGEGENAPSATGGQQPQGAQLRVTLGTQGFAEAKILGELYRQALAANGYTVDLRKNVGPAAKLDEALRDGQIDGHIAYTGTVLSVVAGENVTGLDAQETYGKVKAFYDGRGMAVSERTPFENVDAIATTRSYAQEHRLKEVGDLRRVKRFTLGARPEFENLFLGLEGLQQVYRLTNAQFKPVALGAQYTALDEGDADAANVFTTDAQLANGDYVVLEDPKRLFGSQQVVLVVGKSELERVGSEKFLRVANDVNRRLTRDVMLDMNQAVDMGGQDEAEVAARFLRQAGILQTN